MQSAKTRREAALPTMQGGIVLLQLVLIWDNKLDKKTLVKYRSGTLSWYEIGEIAFMCKTCADLGSRPADAFTLSVLFLPYYKSICQVYVSHMCQGFAIITLLCTTVDLCWAHDYAPSNPNLSMPNFCGYSRYVFLQKICSALVWIWYLSCCMYSHATQNFGKSAGSAESCLPLYDDTAFMTTPYTVVAGQPSFRTLY